MSFQCPAWVPDAVFYEIFPDRFARSRQLNSAVPEPGRLQDWNSPPTSTGYKGGNLRGILDRLDYLVDLGITAIYMTPIFQSACNHRYHPHDFYHVDPLLGGDEAFLSLLEAAHRRGVRIVLDGVFNHASRGFFFFNDILENGPDSPWVDWFKIEGWPLAPYDEDRPANYRGWDNHRALPEFNHDNPAVREYLMRVAEHWVRLGIDGWRLDSAQRVRTPGFWQEFRQRVKAINPECYVVAEIIGEPDEWLDGTTFDGVMNYSFRLPTILFTAGDRVITPILRTSSMTPFPPVHASEYAAAMTKLLQTGSREIQLCHLNPLCNHDTARLIDIAGGDEDTVRLATLLLMTFPGAPCIYYGDEVGLQGGKDPDCRRAFPPEDQWDQSVLSYHRALIKMRHQFRALRAGRCLPLAQEGDTYVFARSLPDEELIISVNAGRDVATINIPKVGPTLADSPPLPSEPATIVFGDVRFGWTAADEAPTLQLTLPPRSGAVFQCTSQQGILKGSVL